MDQEPTPVTTRIITTERAVQGEGKAGEKPLTLTHCHRTYETDPPAVVRG